MKVRAKAKPPDQPFEISFENPKNTNTCKRSYRYRPKDSTAKVGSLAGFLGVLQRIEES